MAVTKVDISMLEDISAGTKVVAVAPSTSGNVLTSDGTDWTSAVAAAGGDTRNFAIDGDFTHWPQGVGPTTGTGGYAPAMMQYQEGTDGTMTWERSTDVPTKAQSGHQSTYSMLLKCTGADTSIGAAQYATLGMYHITGSDFGSLHQQPVTISFWAKTSAANSGHTYYLQLDNRNVDRSYVKSFTPTSSWAKYSFSLTFDTVGTWTNIGLESNYSMRMLISGSAGSDTDDGTDGAWVAGFERHASSPAISNFMDDTANEWYMSQFQIKLGTSTPTFVSPSVATVRSQVAYYFQTSYPYVHGLYPGGAHMNGMVGDLSTSSAFNTGWYCIHSVSFYPMMRKSPTIVTYDRAGTAGTITRYAGNSGASANGITAHAIDSQGATGFRCYVGIGGSPVAYPIYGFHMGYTADARH